MKKGTAFLIFMMAVSFGCGGKPGVKWEKFSPELMAEARNSGQPVLAYFYAAWCPPCYDLKEKTFSDPNVIQALEPLRRIKIDLSFKHSPKIKALSKEYGVVGLPMMSFFDPNGEVDPNFRIRGYVPPEQFYDLVQTFRDKYGIRDLPPPAVS